MYIYCLKIFVDGMLYIFFQSTCHSILKEPCHFGRGILYVFYINSLVSIVQRPSLKWFYCLKDVLCVNKQKNLYLHFLAALNPFHHS